jgi:hypothetical protein
VVHSLIAGFKVDFLILVAVVAGACMNIYAARVVAGRTTRGLARVRIAWERTVSSRILARGSRHAPRFREALSEVPEMGTNCETSVAGCLSDAV